MRSVLVTGGAGFIGSHLVEMLLRRGDAVRVFDNLAAGTLANLAQAIGEDGDRLQALVRPGSWTMIADRCEVVRGDVRDPAALDPACRGVEVVFHLAALRSVPRSLTDPVGTHEVNVGGTLRVLEAARTAGVRRVVYASSSSVYGDTPLPKHEGQVPSPQSPYAASKLAGEAYCRAYSGSHGLSTISLRYFNVFGPRQDPASEYAAVVPRFVQAALRGETAVIYGDGRQTRDFTYVENVVTGTMQAAEAGVLCETVNIGTGRRTSVLDLLGIIERFAGLPVTRRALDARAGDVRDSEADITRARQVLGYNPAVSLEDGMRRTVESFRRGG